MALILKHLSPAELVARFREAYRNADRERLVTLARNLLARMDAGDITDANCRTAFGLTTPQWNALKTKMTNFVAAAATVKGAVGE